VRKSQEGENAAFSYQVETRSSWPTSSPRIGWTTAIRERRASRRLRPWP